jgi:hypothetical protein
MGMAQQSFPSLNAVPMPSTVQTAVTMASDSNTKQAFEAALPNIKKILSIHACIKVADGLLQLNFYALSGVNFSNSPWREGLFPNNENAMKYHDRNKCLSVKQIDTLVMPALNALSFRVIYFADDSGETINFKYLMLRSDDGSWKLQKFGQAD